MTKMKKSKSTALRFSKEKMVPWLFLLPSLILVSIFVLIPFVDVVRRSFFSSMSGQFVGLKNYAAVLQNEAFKLAAKNTVRFTLVCIPLLLILSLILALLIDAIKEQKGILKTSFLIPMSIPVASVVLLWKVFFHENGLLNRILAGIGAEKIDCLNSEWVFMVLIFTYIWKNVGYDMVLWLSGITSISPALYESASLDGANSWQRFLKITLPNLIPTLFTVTVLSLLNSFKVFREAYLIAGSYPDESIYLLQHLFNNWFTKLDVDKMCAGAVLMAITVVSVIGILQWMWGGGEES